MLAAAVRRRLKVKTCVTDVRTPVASVVASASAAASEDTWQVTFLEQEDLTQEEKSKRKKVYLVTLPHPRNGLSNSHGLACPGEFDRKAIVQLFLDVFANPLHIDAASSSRQGTKLTLEKLVVFREMHDVDDNGVRQPHYHVALVASDTFRFASYKRALRVRHNLASHWSCSHEGYWSAVRYGIFWTPKKPQAELDAHPEAWARV